MNGRGVEKKTYETIRACIREGYSVSEAAELCDVSTSTVYRATDDLRKTQPGNEARDRKLIEDLVAGMPMRAVCAKYDLSKPRVSNLARKYGYRFNWASLRYELIGEPPKQQEEEKTTMVATEATEAVKATTSTPVPPVHTALNASLFKNVAISLESEYARYRVLNNGNVTMSLMGADGWVTIPAGALKSLGRELTEIAERFGGLVNA